MPIDTLTDKNLQFPLRIVYLKHDFIQLYLFVRQIFKNYYMYIEKNHILFFFNFIIPLFFTLKTSKYCDKGKKDQYKNQESNIQQYTHSKPNKQNRVHVIV
jgi:hypothetical protein